MKNYIYPKNLKAKMRIAFWRVRDLAVIVLGGIFGIALLINSGVSFPILIICCYAVLSVVTADERTVFGYVVSGAKLLLLEQQEFRWKGVGK